MAMQMKERFSNTELTALRNDLLQGGLADTWEAAELVQVFLMGRGYGSFPASCHGCCRPSRDGGLRPPCSTTGIGKSRSGHVSASN